MEIAQKINCCRQSARDSELTAERVVPKGDVECCLVIPDTGLPVAAGHRDLVKIGGERGEVVGGWLHRHGAI
jgi:hypothetical protein